MSEAHEGRETLLDEALHAATPLERERARAQLLPLLDAESVSDIAALLNAPKRPVRERAARILADLAPDITRPALLAVAQEPAAPERARTAAIRLLAVQSPGDDDALAAALRDPSPRVRAAAANPAAPVEALLGALRDTELAVALRAAEALHNRGHELPSAALDDAVRRHGEAAARLTRYLGALAPTAAALVDRARAGDADGLDFVRDAATLRMQLDGPLRIAAAARLVALGEASSEELHAWAHDTDPRIRACAARGLPPSDPALAALAEDQHGGVAWTARRGREGRFQETARAERRGTHARADAASAQPPFGIRPGDSLVGHPRVDAALALVQPHVDLNLGVAVRSAEAAGLARVVLVGREELLRSAARGTDRVVHLDHVPDEAALVRLAREEGYQLVAVQQSPGSEPFDEADYPPRPLFVVGPEDRGLSEELRVGADLLVEIPMYGEIDSLNVACAASVVLFHWRRLKAREAETAPRA